MRFLARFLFVILVIFGVTPAFAGIDARMMRYPDVSADQIAFVYAGDIWVAPKAGGLAVRLSSPRGEEMFPKFSPDGKLIAFTGNYDGNGDVYMIPAAGGEPVRLTYHPMGDRVVDWYPDGNNILYASSRESGKQRFSQFYRASKDGGMPQKLPVPYGEYGSLSPDAKRLAYMTRSRDFRTWKRYRGGMAPNIWLFDLQNKTAEKIIESRNNDGQPMWHGNTLYFLSDRGTNQRNNIWAYDLASKATRQVTKFDEFDVQFPAIGPSDIVFQAGSKIFLLDLGNETTREVDIQVVTDLASVKPSKKNVARLIQNGGISPSGKRAVFEARGDVFTVPAEHGVIRNMSNSSGSAERFPAWSPDGKSIAFWSDRSGEYELYTRPADGSEEAKKLSSLGAGFRYQIYWSPDSKKVAFVDQAMAIQFFDLDTNQVTQVDKGLWMFEGNLRGFRADWSSDSRWLTYSRGLENRHSAIFLFDTKNGQRHQMTAGFYDDFAPVFDPDGNYLYFFTDRTMRPSYSDFDNSWIYANATNIVAATLRKDVASPLAPRNDEEEVKTEKEEEEKEGAEAEKKEETAEEMKESATGEEGQGDKKPEEDEKKAKEVEIDLGGFEKRIVVLPPEAGNVGRLAAVSGKVVFARAPRTGSSPKNNKTALMYYDLKDRKEETVVGDINDFRISAGGKKVLVVNNGKFAIVDLKPGQKMEKPLRTAELEMTVDPRAEWKQIFSDVWRIQRDFFYDPGMHGVDWHAMRAQYGALLDDAVTRWDVNFVIGELIAELNASHTYRGGGDAEQAPRKGTGLLGVNWSFANGAYRIAKIIDGAPWDSEVRSSLSKPGVDVSEGDYVLAVNGIKMDGSKDPWSAFEGLAEKTVALSVNDKPTMEGAREVLVDTLASETRLRNLAWIESNRRRVEEASDGQVGYVYVPSTGIDGQTELMRQFLAQIDKDGMIIDERFNNGGQIPDRFIELMDRPALAFWAVRDGKDWAWPPFGHFGPKVMLINGWSGSGGDAFPDYFRKAGLGPLIGTRTWGGLIGVSGAPSLIDGGGVTVPTFRMYDPDGKWFLEGHGVDPDIEVIDDQTALAQGRDPQLERAIEEIQRLIKLHPPTSPQRPPYENRWVGVPASTD